MFVPGLGTEVPLSFVWLVRSELMSERCWFPETGSGRVVRDILRMFFLQIIKIKALLFIEAFFCLF